MQLEIVCCTIKYILYTTFRLRTYSCAPLNSEHFQLQIVAAVLFVHHVPKINRFVFDQYSI